MSRYKTTKLLLSISTCVLMTACQTTQPQSAQQIQTGKIDAALDRAAASANARGYSEQSLPILEKSYKRNSNNENAALVYATALRHADYLNRAAIVLAPFANSDTSSSVTKTEYAAIQLAQGNYAAAEQFSQKAIIQDEKNFEAFHYLGIALDAQGMHKEAERSFRKGLELWQGDPTTIMNNLALNLTSQGFLDEAEAILEKALAIAPHRIEIERNLRIVRALKESGGYAAPKPEKKPSSSSKK